MKTLTDILVENRAQNVAQLEAIAALCAEEDGREMTDAEAANADELRAAIDRLDERIAALVKDAERANAAPEPRRTQPGTPGPAPEPRESKPRVEVRSEPGTYDGTHGFRQFLVDLAIREGVHNTPSREYVRSEVDARQERYREECLRSETEEVRAIATSDLAGLVNPQYDPSMISRGIYDAGVTLGLLRRYPVWATGDSITMPRVTTRAGAAVQTSENQTFHATKIGTGAVKADLFTVAAQAPISVQSVERGVLATELLRDEMSRAWIEALNTLILDGITFNGAAGSDQPIGLMNTTANAGNTMTVTDASPTAQKALDYMTKLKTRIWTNDRRLPTALITSPGLIGVWEELQTNGLYTLPPYAAWVQNTGGFGALPAMEGLTASLNWRTVPVFGDPAIGDAFKSDKSASSGGDQSRILAVCGPEVPVFFDGPMTFTFEQTLGQSGQLLLVTRGYAAFNPLWRPEAWAVAAGTGLKLGA